MDFFSSEELENGFLIDFMISSSTANGLSGFNLPFLPVSVLFFLSNVNAQTLLGGNYSVSVTASRL